MSVLINIICIIMLVLFSMGSKSQFLESNFTVNYILLGILTVVVYCNLSLQTAQEKVREALKGLTYTVVCFAMLRIVKFHIPEEYEALERYMWYFYYPFNLVLGYYCMKIVSALDISIKKIEESDWHKYIFILDIIVIVLIFSNDYHQLVFSFSHNFHNTKEIYTGGVLEWPIKVFIMLQFTIPALLLIKDAINFSYFKFRMLIPIGVLAYTIFYNVAYSLRISPFRSSEVVLVTGTAVVAFWYSAFNTKLVSANDKYMELFYASGLHKKIAATRLRQQLFLKLENIVAEEKLTILGGIEQIKNSTNSEERLSVLQHLRLAASLIKKQSLMFLQGEIYGYVPLADFQAALREGLHYAKENNSFYSLKLKLQGEGFGTDVALITHNLIMQAFMIALNRRFDSLLITVNCDAKLLETIILVDSEHREDMEQLHTKFTKLIKYGGSYNLVLRTTEDAVALRLIFEEAGYES